MRPDPNKKTARSFQCRDYLWDVFERMSTELECSVDYLINEAMRQYARQRQTGAFTNATQIPDSPHSGLLGSTAFPQGGPPPLNTFSAVGAVPVTTASAATGLPPSPAGVSVPTGATKFTAPPPLPQAPTGFGGPSMPAAAEVRPGAVAMPTLYVVIDGQKVKVTKPEFVVGRSSKTADLAVPDGNISRRHAVIVYQNGVFYFRDLGSTNGIEFQGRRVESKAIEEGDVFSLCDHQVKFTFR